MTARKQCASLFELDGAPKMSQAIPLALQHVVAMIVGCVTPAIIISGAAGIDTADRVLLIQASLVVSALSTLLQLFPIGRKNGFHLGSALPVILGVSFAYVPSMQAIAETSGIAAILGAQIAGGICAVVVGLSIKKIRRFFPPLIAGTVLYLPSGFLFIQPLSTIWRAAPDSPATAPGKTGPWLSSHWSL